MEENDIFNETFSNSFYYIDTKYGESHFKSKEESITNNVYSSLISE